jgi:pilus assembly protein CpaC
MLLGVCLTSQSAHAQAQVTGPEEARFRVQGAAERLEMIINSSRILEFGFDVPRLLVNNPDLITASPLTPNSVQLSAKKQGYTQINVWDPNGKVITVDVQVLGDIRELDTTLKHLFPEASLTLRPLNSSLYISGYVPKAEMVGQIAAVAQDYFPQIVNSVTVGGVQEVLLHVKVMEVSRTKLKQAGIDWNVIANNGYITNGATSIISPSATALAGLTGSSTNNVRFGISNGPSQFNAFLTLLEQSNMAKLLAEPTLTTMSGRPASFNVGGEIPVPLLSSNGAPSILFREFGTQIDFVPIVLGNGLIRLEVRPAITEVASDLAVSGVPGFRSRRADVGVEMQAGQTLAIAGLVFNKTEAEVKGVPLLADLPWLGAAFRKTTHKQNEVELVILVRPEFAGAMDSTEVPPCGPGQLTTQPTNCEIYGRGYMEVPKCAANGACYSNQGGMNYQSGSYPTGSYETVPAQGGPQRAVPQQVQPQGLPPAPVPADPVPLPPANQQTRGTSKPTIKPIFGSSKPSGLSTPTQPAASSSSAVAAQQVSWHPTQNRSQPNNRSTGTAANAAQIPTLIGPVGYDNLK